MLQIAREAHDDPEAVRSAPHNRPVARLDEVRAAKQPVVRYAFESRENPVKEADAEPLGVPKGV
jgi:glycine dehydrogenase subunit 2